MSVRILEGDALMVLRTLEPESVQVCITSPPYFNLRDYGVAGQIGLESTPAAFIAALLDVFDEVKRVLRPDGLAFVNLGDSYAGSGKGPTGKSGIGDQRKRQGFADAHRLASVAPKNLLLIPERFALAMQDDGWIARSRIAWCKASAMPESVRDRPTSAWEHIWMFSKSRTYYYDADAVRQPWSDDRNGASGARVSKFADRASTFRVDGGVTQPPQTTGANLRNFWLLGPEPSSLEHYAGFPTEIPRRCILAGSRKGDKVLDPFLGSGTTALVADRLGRDAIGIELNPTYAEMARRRIENDAGPLLAEPVQVQAVGHQPGLFEVIA